MSDEANDKHTPGPWFSMSAITDPENVDGLRENDGAILVTQDKDDDYESDIAYVIGRHVSAPKRSDEEIAANARLIAAAPQLLASLREMLNMAIAAGGIRGDDVAYGLGPADWIEGMDRAIKAIQKARGEV